MVAVDDFGIGTIRDFFHSVGTVPVWRDKFIKTVTDGAIHLAVTESGPVATSGRIVLSRCSTSLVEQVMDVNPLMGWGLLYPLFTNTTLQHCSPSLLRYNMTRKSIYACG